MKNRYGKLLLIFVLFLISSLAFTPDANAMGSVARDEKSINLTNTNDEIYRIEQVRAVMPYVRAYFYPDDSYKNATEVKGKLGDKELTMTESKTWKETAYGIDYYFLIDNSKSVSSADFEEVKKEIADTASYLNTNDTVSIYLVGDTNEKLAGKINASDTAKITEVLDGIKREGMNTNLYNAIKDAATDIASEDTETVFSSSGDLDKDLGLGKNRSVIVAVTDGVNDTTNGYGKDETITKLSENNIPLYLIQQRMQGEKGGESRSDIQQVVRQTGGAYFLMDDYEESGAIVSGLSEVLNSCVVATFEADTNNTISGNVSFNIEYQTSEGTKTFNEKEVKADKHVTESDAPAVNTLDVIDEHTIKIVFTENVSDEAKNVSLYQIVDERGNNIKPTGADFDVDGRNTILLTTADTLWNGDYDVTIASGITDVSEEKNPMESVVIKTTYTEGEDYVEKKESFFQRFWWAILAVFVLAVVLTLVIIFVKIKKRKGLVVVDDQVVLADNVEEQIHLQINKVQAPPVKRGVPIVLVVKNGAKTIKEINANVDGSLIVGRSDICDVYIDDPHMSKQHFALEFDGMNFYIMDLESHNGTFLNGVRLMGKRKLERNDKIKAGVLDIVVRW